MLQLTHISLHQIKKLLPAVVLICLFLSVLFIGATPVVAQDQQAVTTSTSVFGTIEKPIGVSNFDTQEEGGIGLLNFLSQIIRLATVVAGLIAFFNILISGLSYLTADGNAKVNEQARNRITYSIIGLIIMVSAYTIIAVISLILFRDASFILNPVITPPGQTPPTTP